MLSNQEGSAIQNLIARSRLSRSDLQAFLGEIVGLLPQQIDEPVGKERRRRQGNIVDPGISGPARIRRRWRQDRVSAIGADIEASAKLAGADPEQLPGEPKVIVIAARRRDCEGTAGNIESECLERSPSVDSVFHIDIEEQQI